MSIHLDIKKKYEDFTLDLHLHTDSKRIGILGSSGSGKSLTLKCIAGIESPEEGKILLDDRVLYDQKKKKNPKTQDRKVGYLFQNYALFPNMTVLQNIEMGMKEKKEEASREYIRRFHLEGLENHYPNQLSGGQQQRVALARILASSPEAILLDEPFSALDISLKDQLQHELKAMLSQYDGTVILVSHSRDEVYRFCDELLIIDQGRSICQGSVKDLFKNPEYVAAARLTGCKNIVAVEKMDEHHLRIPSWNLILELHQTIDDRIHFMGVRAHDLIPLWEKEENSIAIRTMELEELPFERQYYVRASVDGEAIRWFVQKDQYERIDQRGFPTYLKIPEEKILLLC